MKNGFTLIELLVVITIIVVLLALLTPALDKAIYQADLAVCAAQLRTVGSGASGYAFDHKRRYPYRAGVHDPDMQGLQPRHLTNSPLYSRHQNPFGYDDRPLYRTYFGLKASLCPLTDDLDLDTPDSAETTIFASYPMWFGWQYVRYGEVPGAGGTNPALGRTEFKGMFRLGDRFGWDGEQFDVLAGDHQAVGGFGTVEAAHPDDNGALPLKTADNEGDAAKVTVSHYFGGTANIGQFDPAYVRTDGSVQRYDNVRYDGDVDNGKWWVANPIDPRLSHVPFTNWENTDPSRIIVPRGQ